MDDGGGGGNDRGVVVDHGKDDNGIYRMKDGCIQWLNPEVDSFPIFYSSSFGTCMGRYICFPSKEYPLKMELGNIIPNVRLCV